MIPAQGRTLAARVGGRVAFLAVAVCASACSTTRMVRGYVPIEYPNEATVRLEVSPGDEVKVTTDDGRLFMGKVTEVDAAGIAGVGAFHGAGMPTAEAETRFTYDDILTLEVMGLRPEKQRVEEVEQGVKAFATAMQVLIGAAEVLFIVAVLVFIL